MATPSTSTTATVNQNENSNSNSTESKSQSNGLFGDKEQLRSLMSKAKNEYLEKHKDLVNEYLKTKPSATTIEILNHIRLRTEGTNASSAVSLNCLFLLFIALLIIVLLRIQYNIFVEELVISSLFFSLNPSIDIHLLFHDLALKIDKCAMPKYIAQTADNKQWIANNIEYCDFIAMSINRKLLYLNEYSFRKYSQNSQNLYVFMQWILNERFAIKNKRKKRVSPMPLSAIQSKKDIQTFIVSNFANARQKWSVYKDNIESNYGKKRMVAFEDILYRLALEVSHYLFTNSLFGLNINSERNNNSEIDLAETMAIIEAYLRYEYFRDGFVCALFKTDKSLSIGFVTIHQLFANKNIRNYLDLLQSKEMICINTFEQIGRFSSDLKIYLQIIEKGIAHWLSEKPIPMSVTVTVVDNNIGIKKELLSLISENNQPFWDKYEWLKSGGISMESLLIHDRLIYGKSHFKSVDFHKYYSQNNKNNKPFLDIKSYMRDMHKSVSKTGNNELRLFYSNSVMFHKYYFEQFKTKELLSKDLWKGVVSQFIAAINRQFGGVVQMTQSIIEYINANYVFYNPGFVWLLCENKNNKLYFAHTLKYALLNHSVLSSNDGVLMGFDVWTHSFYYDFIKGNKLKQIEYAKINKKKYKTKEIIGQSIDVTHIGTSLQKTFNFPRTQMEMFGYYLSSIFQNLDWLKIAHRWEAQCPQTIRDETSQSKQAKKSKGTQNDPIIKQQQHQEL